MPVFLSRSLRIRPLAWLTCICATILMGFVLAYDIRSIQGEQAKALQQKNLLLARAFAEHTLATVRLVDSALLAVIDHWRPDKIEESGEEISRISRRLSDLSLQVAITDGGGVMRYSSLGIPAKPLDLSDREHIRVHFGRTDSRLFISAPVKGRVSGKWSIQFTRPIFDGDKLQGVAVISVDPKYFFKFYESLGLNAGDVVTMVRENGQILARFPSGDAYLGQKLTGVPYLLPAVNRSGVFSRRSQMDGIERIYAWFSLKDYGLHLVAGSISDLLAPEYADRIRANMLGGGGFCIALYVLAFFVVRQVEGRETRARDLARTARELEDRVAERTAELSRSLKEGISVSQLMNKILSSSPSILFVRSVSSQRITYVSPNVSAILGWSVDEVLDQPGFMSQHIHPEDGAQSIQDVSDFKLRTSVVRRFRIARADERYVWIHEELNLLRDASENPVEIVGSWSVVDDQVRIEEQLRHSQKLEAVGQLTGGLAHDFNNLLGVVVGKLDQLDERLPAEDATLRANLDVARRAALQGAEVTRSLLAIARRQPMEMRVHDLNALLREMLPLIRASVGTNVDVREVLSPGKLEVSIDAGGFSNSVLNLVLNARDAMMNKAGHRVLELRTSRHQVDMVEGSELAAGEYATLAVVDNGIGMSRFVLDQAFNPFFTTKQRGKGTGLGLAMVRGYTEQLGGTTSIESTEGNGTIVRLYLPMAAGADKRFADGDGRSTSLRAHRVLDASLEAESDALEQESAPTAEWSIALTSEHHQRRENATSEVSSPPGQSGSGLGESRPAGERSVGRPRVLVVDDEQGLCEIAASWLDSLGYEAVWVLSPDDALKRLGSERFDVLFTDVVMPGAMDGVALGRLAKERDPRIVVLLASGYARSLIEGGPLPGVLLNKPYRRKDLATAVSALLGGKATETAET